MEGCGKFLPGLGIENAQDPPAVISDNQKVLGVVPEFN